MNLKTRPLLIAAGLGGLIQLVLSVAVQSLSVLALSKSFSGTQPTNSFSPILSGVGLSNCLCVVLLDILVGAAYGLLYPREESFLPGDVILGGGISAALARLGSGLVALVLSLVLLPLIFNQMGLPSAEVGSILTLGMAMGTVCGIFGLVLSALIGALFGFLGGGIVVLIRERRSGQLSGAGLL